MEEQLKRVNKFIGETGFCSRREADKLIEDGRVTVNGVVPEMGTKVSDRDEVRIDGKLIREKTGKFVYLAFNKPAGIECTTNQDVPENIVDYINYPQRIFPIGRLDKASEGLIFMTNDGDIVNKILRARNNHEKEYTVTVNKPITDRFIERMGNGVPILDTITRKCKVEQVSRNTFKIILTQGLNRQIRRMCEYFDYEVVALKRIRIINISLDIPLGRYRELTSEEISELNHLIEPSTKTEEASLPREERKEYDHPKPFNTNRRSTVNRDESAKQFFKRDESTRQNLRKIEPNKGLFRSNDASDNDSRIIKPDADKENSRNTKPSSTARKAEFIKKDDPRYKGKGDY